MAKPLKPRTKKLEAMDRAAVWHPFTQMASWIESEDFPVIERGKGCTLVDTDGNRYLDGISSLWCNIHGHRVKKIDNAVRKQMAKIAHSTLLGLAGPPSIILAHMLLREAPPGLSRVFYSDNGSTAVEVAVKMAVQYHRQTGGAGKNVLAGLAHAYHGDTVGSVSIGGMELFHSIFSALRFDVVRIPSPHCYRCPEKLERESCNMACAATAEKIIESNAGRLAALVVEPLVQGAAGMIVHPAGFLGRLRAACDRHSILLIADEVATGFGRTGTVMACSQEDVTPDILCLSKGLSAGYLPLAATLTTEKVFKAFLGPYTSHRTFFHGHTYTGNALGCAAAIESLKLLKKNVMPELEEKISLLHGLLQSLIAPLRHVGDIRSRGMMIGIELVRDRDTGEPYPEAERMGHRVILEARARGVILRPLGDVIVLMPAPAMKRSEIKRLVRVTADAIAAATGGGKEKP